ncbi:MAG TPA: hypothetical protein VF026_12765 [Ktedonobacteraceae bacterium]
MSKQPGNPQESLQGLAKGDLTMVDALQRIIEGLEANHRLASHAYGAARSRYSDTCRVLAHRLEQR